MTPERKRERFGARMKGDNMPPMIITDYAKAVAAHCGTHPGVVAEILQLSRENECVYHGISMSTALDDVRHDGIMPRRTSDAMIHETVWASGKCLYSSDGKSPESTRYSTFFHHAHNKLGMSLAVSPIDEIDRSFTHIYEESPPDARLGHDDGTFVIRDFLPRVFYTFLHVNLPVTIPGVYPERSRRIGIAGEAKMMDLLVDFLRGDIKMGQSIETSIMDIL